MYFDHYKKTAIHIVASTEFFVDDSGYVTFGEKDQYPLVMKQFDLSIDLCEKELIEENITGALSIITSAMIRYVGENIENIYIKGYHVINDIDVGLVVRCYLNYV